MIEFNNVSKIYNNNVKALSDVSVKIDSGDFVFLVGPSGSGKSTFIKMLLKEIQMLFTMIVLIIFLKLMKKMT